MPRWGKERAAWVGMQDRCYNPKSTSFHHYGARGISICERWRKDVWTFLADMGPAPTRKHSIDRINNDGNYEPGNCRWATPSEQARNKRYLGRGTALDTWTRATVVGLRDEFGPRAAARWFGCTVARLGELIDGARIDKRMRSRVNFALLVLREWPHLREVLKTPRPRRRERRGGPRKLLNDRFGTEATS